jgi:hypothetical protein
MLHDSSFSSVPQPALVMLVSASWSEACTHNKQLYCRRGCTACICIEWKEYAIGACDHVLCRQQAAFAPLPLQNLLYALQRVGVRVNALEQFQPLQRCINIHYPDSNSWSAVSSTSAAAACSFSTIRTVCVAACCVHRAATSRKC